VHHRAGQSGGPVPGDRRRGRLLKRVVGEQPPGHVTQLAEFGTRLAAQQDGFDQSRAPVAEPLADRGDVGEQAGVGQRMAGDIGQRRRTGVTGEVGDVVAPEGQDGLTPVIMTL
jgi:hypothetical protein